MPLGPFAHTLAPAEPQKTVLSPTPSIHSRKHLTLEFPCPIWHTKQDRIRAHLFLAVLAYHGVHLLRMLLQRHGIRTSWARIRQQLSNWMRLTTKDGEVITSR